MDWQYSLLGAIVGLLVGVTGVGGGSLLTPILVFVFGVSPVIAVGTDLAFSSITKAFGLAAHHAQQTVDWRIVQLLAIGSIPAAIATLFLIGNFIHVNEALNTLIKTSVGVALLLTSATLFLRISPWWTSRMRLELSPRVQTVATVISGGLLGVLVTLTSVGAGAIGAVILTLLYPRLPTVGIAGTDIVHAFLLTTVGAVGYWQFDGVDTTLLFSLLVGSVPAILLGSYLGKRLPDRITKPLLASILFAAGLKFVTG